MHHRFPRRGAALALALAASLLSCGRDLTGPGGRGALASLQIAPDFSSMVDSVEGVAYSVADLVPFNRVRIELRRLDNSVAASRVVDFPSDATEIPLEINVRLGAAAQNGAEPLTAYLRYINAAGDTVFAGGPIAVTAESGNGQTEPVSIPIVPTAPGAVFASVSISPDSAQGNAGATLTFTATGFDAQGGVVSNAIIGFVSRNPALVQVPNLGQGSVTLVGTRGSTWLVAQSLTGLRDSAFIKILPVPSQIVKVSGDAQTALQGATFTQPLRVRVTASDNLPVQGAPVTFTVTSGGGSVSATTAQTDSAGFASVMWTAGSSLGAASVTASVGTPAITTTFTGSQVNAGPTSLAFETEPINITAGDTLPPIRVAVRNALGQAITGFTGAVSLTRVGTGGGLLVGDTAVAAVAGVATFRGLTLTRAGTDYRLVAVLSGVPNQLSSTFAVTAAPPHAIQLVSGGGQVSDASTVLPAPIVVRVVDVFAQPVVGSTVNFAVQSGGGSAAPTSASTDANGQASTSWTLGAAGAQALRVTAGPAPALNVTATLNDLAGPPRLFAGVDSTMVRNGFSRRISLYLSSLVDTAVTVTLGTNTPGLQWATTTATFAPQTRRTEVVLAAGDTTAFGTYLAYASSALGTDTILVAVDSAFVMFVDPWYTEVSSGDTVHIPVRIAEPAPPGGITVRVRSADTSLARVMAATGAGNVTPGCLDPDFCLNLAQTTIGTPADSVDVVIPEGELLAHVAMLVSGPLGISEVAIDLQASAAKHRSNGIRFWASNALPIFSDPISTIGVGLARTVSLSTSQSNPARDRTFRLRSLTPALFSVDSLVVIPRLEFYTAAFDVRGLAAGTGQLEYGNALLGYDTLTVTVVQPRLDITNTSVTGPPSSTIPVDVYLNTAGNPSYMSPLADLAVTVASLDTTIARVEATQLTVPGGDFSTRFDVRFVSAGSTRVIATAPGFAPDTMQVFVNPVSFTVNTGSGTLGVGTVADWMVSIPFRNGDVGAPRSIAVQPRRPGVARAVVPEFDIARGSSGLAIFQMVGISAGVDTADLYLDGVYTQSVPYRVSTPRLRLNTASVQAIDPDSTFTWTLPPLLTDSLNFTRLAADTIRGILRSSDPSVLTVRDSVIEILPNQSTITNTASVAGVQPGTAILTLTARGFANFVDTITVRAPAIVASTPSVVGIGLVNYASIARTSAPTSALPLTITHQGPGRVEFVNAVTQFPASQDLLFEYFRGVTAGVDTVILSAAGHTPDTLVLSVSASRANLVLDQTVSAGFTEDFASAALRIGESSIPYEPARDRRFIVRSLDTTKARVLQDTIVVPTIGSSTLERGAEVRYLNAGLVSLVLTDVDGEFPPDTADVQIERGRLTGWTDWDQHYMPIGVRQRSYDDNMYVELDYEVVRDTWVHFTTSRPGLVTVPDSALIPAGESYASFNIFAGDTVGAVRVTASIPGLTPWEFDVVVTRSLIRMCDCSGYVGADNAVELTVVDGLVEYARPMASTATFRLTSGNPGVASIMRSLVSIPANSDFVFVPAVRGVAPGRTTIRAADTLSSAFSVFEDGSGEMAIQQPTLSARNTRYLTAPGLSTSGSDHIVDASVIRDSIWVRLASTTGRMQPATDSVLVARGGAVFDNRIMSFTDASLTPFRLRGVSAGEDTVVFSAAGLPTHRVPVTVQPGLLRLAANTPSVITVGDSVLVRVNFAGPDGSLGATTAASVTLNFGFLTPGLRLAPSVVNAVDASIVVPPGQTFATFWVRATSAGFGTFEINSPSFRPLRITFEARNRP